MTGPGKSRVPKRGTPEVRAAVRALKLLEAFALAGRPLTLSELARRVELPVSTCHLILQTLLHRGYLYKTRNRYYPTRRIVEHASRIVRHDPLIERLAPLLSELRDRMRETVALVKLQGARALILCVFDSPFMVRPYSTAGTLWRLHSTAAGKALLGGLDEPSRSALLREIDLTASTPNTVRSRTELRAQIERMAARGWFSNDRESASDVTGVAVPAWIDEELFALVLFGPTYRVKRRLSEHGEALLMSKRRLEEAIVKEVPRRRSRRATRARTALRSIAAEANVSANRRPD